MRHTNATKAKLSALRMGANNPFYGKKHTPETRAKLAKILRIAGAKRQYEISPATISLPTKEAELGYLAGLLDGEGSVRFRRGRPFVAIYNTDKRVMKWLTDHVGGNVGSWDNRGRKRVFAWTLCSARNVYVACVGLLPYLVIKCEDVTAVISHLQKKYGDKLDGNYHQH